MKWFTVALLLGSGLLISGCLRLPSGGIVGIRSATDKSVVYRGTIDQVEAGVRDALKEMGGKEKDSPRKEEANGPRSIFGMTADHDEITITMKPKSNAEVLVEVRVGRFGSKSKAERYHATLMKYLKAVL